MARRPKIADRLGLADVGEARSDYTMAKRSGTQTRLKKGVPSQGAGADYHYRNESDWLWMQELAWEFFRNHIAVGSIVKRAVENMIQDGFNYDPRTGDAKLDKDLKDWWADCSIDPHECSPDGESCFVDQEEQALLTTLVGGDCFGLPVDDEYGTVDFRESQFCRSPTWGKNRNIFHGVEMDPATRRRVNYFFTDQPIPAWSPITKGQLTATAAYYFDEITQREERNVFHVRLLGRMRQTRGVTAFAPLFNPAEYLDDIEYLEMVHKRVASLFAFIVNRANTFDPKYLAAELAIGVDVTEAKARDEIDANNRQYKEVAPGSVLRSLPGEQVVMQSANIPNPEHFPHVKMMLTYIGINLGMPLVMVLMDASETNFSGWRGAVDMARSGFRRNQRRLITRFHCPYLRFKLLKYAERDASIRRFVAQSLKPNAKINLFSHWWQPPSWPYIQPVDDATADLIRDASLQISPRRRCQERGYEWNELYRETAEDRFSAWQLAAEKVAEAKQQVETLGIDSANVPHWRDFAPLPIPERITVSLGGKPAGDEPRGNDPSKKPDERTR